MFDSTDFEDFHFYCKTSFSIGFDQQNNNAEKNHSRLIFLNRRSSGKRKLRKRLRLARRNVGEEAGEKPVARLK